jgi:serine/threonine protein kinase
MNRRTRKRSTRQKGGKLVGQGTFGCGFFPALRCAADHNQRSHQLSKFLLSDNAIKEFQLTQNIRKIDPDMKYSIYPNIICNLHPDDFEIANEEGLFNCDLLPKDKTLEEKKKMYDAITKQGVFKLLQAPHGGETLYNITRNIVKSQSNKKEKIIKSIKAMGNLIEGLQLYQTKNFVHLDIKSDNVVCDDTCKYIDFGMSENINNIFKPNSKLFNDLHSWSLKKILFNYRSFDLMFIFDDIWQKLQSVAANGSSDDFFEQNVSTYFDHLVKKTEIPLEVFNAIYVFKDKTAGQTYSVSFINSYKTVRDIINRFVQENTHSSLSASKTRKHSTGLSKSLKKFILLQSDVYSLGLMLVAQVRDLFNVQMYYGNLYNLGAAATQGKPITNTIIDHEIIIDLFELCKKMMHLDPFQRYNSKQAAEKYRQILKKINKL